MPGWNTTVGVASFALTRKAPGTSIVQFFSPFLGLLFKVLQILKKKNPDIQVILLTGQATLSKGIEAMKLGALDFIEKPADIKILTEKIKEAQAQKMMLVEKKMEEKMKKLIHEKAW